MSVSSQQEKEALLQFMGSIYGETRKLEGELIETTNTLRRDGSQAIKKSVEELVKTQSSLQPVQSPANIPVQEPLPAPQPVMPPVAPPIEDGQMELKFDLNEKELLLKRIEGMEQIVRNQTKLINQINKSIQSLIGNE